MTELRENETIATRIRGYQVEVDFFIDMGEQRTSCVISYEREDEVLGKLTYSGSLTLLENYHYLDCDDSRDGPWDVPSKTVEQIADWARDKGY